MRKRNKVKQLQREAGHRKAMLRNLIVSLFYHERIESTIAKAKVVRQLAEKLISRARRNLSDKLTPAQKVHNIRQARKLVRDREVLQKLFSDIAPRYANYEKGGYTRVLKIGRRQGDAAEMAMVELVERKELAQLKEDRKKFRAQLKGNARVKTRSSAGKVTKEKKDKK